MTGRARTVGIVVMVASMLAVAIASYTGWRSRAYAECQAGVIEALVSAQVARAQAADQDRAALDAMVFDVLSATSDAQSRAALERYRETRARADAERAAHPLPPLPSSACH